MNTKFSAKLFVLPFTVALAAVLATTGCKKGITRITPLPGPPQPIVSDIGSVPPNGGQIPGGANPFGSGSGVGSQPIATSTNWDPADTIQDRSALAAYTVHFQFDSAVVQDSEQSNLSAVAQALNADPNVKLLIEGNCDERGTEEYNRALGERRALALRQALAGQGIDANRIRTISYGKDKPVDPAHNSAAWAKNRRGDFVLCHPKSGV